jgi:hypothetical protein
MTDDLCIDACPECDHRNPTLPRSVAALKPESRGVRCEYVCSEGHAWMCSWAEPAPEPAEPKVDDASTVSRGPRGGAVLACSCGATTRMRGRTSVTCSGCRAQWHAS